MYATPGGRRLRHHAMVPVPHMSMECTLGSLLNRRGIPRYSTPAITATVDADGTLADFGVLVGFDDDLAGKVTHISNRIHWLLTGIHSALERVLGRRITHRAVLETCLTAAVWSAYAPPEPAH